MSATTATYILALRWSTLLYIHHNMRQCNTFTVSPHQACAIHKQTCYSPSFVQLSCLVHQYKEFIIRIPTHVVLYDHGSGPMIVFLLHFSHYIIILPYEFLLLILIT